MSISDKTRKILWGLSGNRCAFCRQGLVIDATAQDDQSVVGDECHIVSPKNLGPRHRPETPPEVLDGPDNLILLCQVHHKMVDDQLETYTIEMLKTLKANHENWVSASLATEPKKRDPIKVVRMKENIPSHLRRLTSGQELMNVISDSCAYSFEHDEPKSEDEMEIIKGFLQEAQDWGELSSDFEAGQKVEAAFRMSAMIRELESAGFWIFGARENRRLEGGIDPPSTFPVVHLKVARATNPEIVKIVPRPSDHK